MQINVKGVWFKWIFAPVEKNIQPEMFANKRAIGCDLPRLISLPNRYAD